VGCRMTCDKDIMKCNGLMYADGYLFFLEDDDLLSYDEAKEKCSQSEGYQLGIFKTEATFNILHNAFLRLREGLSKAN
ncbi:hypothetical protein Avbf_00475, partial [Armadillidium vulgare]